MILIGITAFDHHCFSIFRAGNCGHPKHDTRNVNKRFLWGLYNLSIRIRYAKFPIEK